MTTPKEELSLHDRARDCLLRLFAVDAGELHPLINECYQIIRDQAVELERVKGISKESAWIPVEPGSMPEDGQTVLGGYKALLGGDNLGSAETLTYQAEDAEDGPECWVNCWGKKADRPTHWKPWEAPK